MKDQTAPLAEPGLKQVGWVLMPDDVPEKWRSLSSHQWGWGTERPSLIPEANWQPVYIKIGDSP